MAQKLVWIALAGGMGTLARYGLTAAVARFAGSESVWATLAVNVAGCFLAGLLWAVFEHRFPVPADIHLIVFVGFMGAFTTFSSLIVDGARLAESAGILPSLANIAIHNVLGIVALAAGWSLAAP